MCARRIRVDVTHHGAAFEAAIVLPGQFGARRSVLQAEQRLALAVLEDAVSCVQRFARARTSQDRRLLVEAEAWLFSDEDTGPFSCVNVCASLGLDVAYLRRGLLAWADRARAATEALVPYRARRNGGSRTRATRAPSRIVTADRLPAIHDQVPTPAS